MKQRGLMYGDRNSLYRLFHGAPIPVEWDGWQSNTHLLEQRGWEVSAEEATDNYSMSHRVRLGLLNPQKTMMITGQTQFPHNELMGGIDSLEFIHRIGFRNMGTIHQRDVHRVMPEAEYMSVSGLHAINLHEPMDVPRDRMMPGRFKFFNYAEHESKEIILPPNSVEACLNHILKLQYPEQVEMKKKLYMPNQKPILQARILTMAA